MEHLSILYMETLEVINLTVHKITDRKDLNALPRLLWLVDLATVVLILLKEWP